MLNFIPLPYRILGGILAIIAIFGFGYVKGLAVGNNKLKLFEAQSKIQYERLRADYERVKNSVNERIVVKYVDRIVEVTKWRTKNVTVTKLVPDTCELSSGWVHVHDSAAEGHDADSTAAADGTPSGIKAPEALETVADNYGACAANTEKLKAWQEWYTEQKAEIDNINNGNNSGSSGIINRDNKND